MTECVTDVAAGERAIRAVAAVADTPPYQVRRYANVVDLRLDSNEGVAPPASLLVELAALDVQRLQRYPSTRPLEESLARRLGVASECVVVTAGADDALDRACRAVLGPGRELILPTPTFEMLERYPPLVGGRCVTVPWPGGPYPIAAVCAAINERTSAIAVVTPNNPTGAVATAADLAQLSAAAPRALLMVDLAYTEFADVDLTPVVLALPNAIAVRTFSKAWGLAGLRVGYAVGPPDVIGWLRAAGSPYPTSSLSLALALRRLERDADAVRQFVQCVRVERAVLQDYLQVRHAQPWPSQGNFVLARFNDAERVHGALGARGIAVRNFTGRPELTDCLRITVPGEPADFDRLIDTLDIVLAGPKAGGRRCV